ncbi:hypothetical protein SKAU_G00292920 [Synaphobranchus kaupii]|uniref:Uncharacterized protein n=1 Tax=Synaphobranchus kaupii TaxID=118154 RepID=A0A9Q1EU49_SYNKA|nr:hypothetical protein SKAU_G00292920 [Synaphobranchus kaupii]
MQAVRGEISRVHFTGAKGHGCSQSLNCRSTSDFISQHQRKPDKRPPPVRPGPARRTAAAPRLRQGRNVFIVPRSVIHGPLTQRAEPRTRGVGIPSKNGGGGGLASALRGAEPRHSAQPPPLLLLLLQPPFSQFLKTALAAQRDPLRARRRGSPPLFPSVLITAFTGQNSTSHLLLVHSQQ